MSAWIDYFNVDSLQFLKELYTTNPFKDKDYIWDDPNVGIWIDMNEPACFEKSDKTMTKTNHHKVQLLDIGGKASSKLVEHRDVHSLYGLYSNKVTYEALLKRCSNERPFILSRSFYPGAQKYSAIWSGDSASDWDNFEKCVPILLQKTVCGISFIGGDVPGFYNNPLLPKVEEVEHEKKEEVKENATGQPMPKLVVEKIEKPQWDEELITSWYRLGIYMPFFRAHSHIDTLRREPWCFSDAACSNIKSSIILRYKLLVYLYTQFYLSTDAKYGSNSPIMRPLWYQYPDVKDIEKNETSFCFGPALIVSIQPEKNFIPRGIDTQFEIDCNGDIVKSNEKVQGMNHIKQQVVQG